MILAKYGLLGTNWLSQSAVTFSVRHVLSSWKRLVVELVKLSLVPRVEKSKQQPQRMYCISDKNRSFTLTASLQNKTIKNMIFGFLFYQVLQAFLRAVSPGPVSCLVSPCRFCTYYSLLPLWNVRRKIYFFRFPSRFLLLADLSSILSCEWLSCEWVWLYTKT